MKKNMVDMKKILESKTSLLDIIRIKKAIQRKNEGRKELCFCSLFLLCSYCSIISLITKGGPGGATLGFALRSKGEGGQPRYLII